MIRTSTPPSRTRLVHGKDGLFADCPDCNGRDFLVDETGVIAFTCLACGSQWHYHLGYVWRLNAESPVSDTVS